MNPRQRHLDIVVEYTSHERGFKPQLKVVENKIVDQELTAQGLGLRINFEQRYGRSFSA